MTWKRFRKPVVCLAAAAGLCAPALAFLGNIVFDPSNFEEAVRQLLQMEQQYEQLVRTYQVVRDQYDHLRRMARPVPVTMAVRYRAAATLWRPSSATNVYGTTGAWLSGINTGTGVAEGYAKATQPLRPYGGALGNIPADHLERVKTNYATVELSDGANQHAMETIGRLRHNAADVERAIQGLEDDSLSAAPDMNTEIAVLNKINAANLISIRSAQDANKLLVTLAEEQVIDAKRRRDAEAQTINHHIRFMTEGKGVMNAQTSGASAAMLAWRMP